MELHSACEASNFKRRNWLHTVVGGSRIPLRTQLEGSLNPYDWCFFALLTEGADHSRESTTETSPPLPSGGLPFPSLHLLLTPERQTSDWPRYISEQIPLSKAQHCVAFIVQNSGENIPSAMFPPCFDNRFWLKSRAPEGSRSSCWCLSPSLKFSILKEIRTLAQGLINP